MFVVVGLRRNINHMDMKVARRSTDLVNGAQTKTCSYWLAGRCNRNPCRFLHSLPSTTATVKKPHFSSHVPNPKYNHSKRVYTRNTRDETPLVTKASKKVYTTKSTDETPVLVTEASQKSTICKYWVNDNCVHGDHCRNLHSWFSGDGISSVAKLQGHEKLVTGIALPVGSDKLYSASTDGTIRTWDCHSGQCTNVANLGAEVTSLITEGSWIFAGLCSSVKAWNFQTSSLFTLHGPKGRILAMVTGHGTLLAAAEDGVISAWRCNSDANSPFELVASLTGHTKSVVCLTIGCTKMLYSGSIDQTIKVWDLDTLECTETLTGHTGAVTALICWDEFLLSGSSDGTIKIWGRTEDGTLKVMYTYTVEMGVVALCGLTDAEGKHILCCSCVDNSVYLYELPSFSERGQLFAKKEVGSIEVGPDRLIFTGDRTGLLTVWKLLEEPKVAASS